MDKFQKPNSKLQTLAGNEKALTQTATGATQA
jgi:hypothetical protein